MAEKKGVTTRWRFAMVSKQLMEEEWCDSYLIATFAAIHYYCSGTGVTSFPSYQKIMKVAHISRDKLGKCLKLLEEKKYLHRISGYEGKPNIYDLDVPSTPHVLTRPPDGPPSPPDVLPSTPHVLPPVRDTYPNETYLNETNEEDVEEGAPASDVRTLIAKFYDLFKQRTGSSPTVEGGKWAGQLARLRRQHSKEDIINNMKYFFDYEKRTDFSFSTWLSRYDALAFKVNQEGGEVKKWEIRYQCPECKKLWGTPYCHACFVYEDRMVKVEYARE